MSKPQKAPQVVTFSESGNFSAAGGAGKKRKRDEAAEDAMKIERSAYLSGDTSKVLAAATGRLPAPKPRKEFDQATADRNRIKVNFEDMFKDVTQLGASTFTGKDKKVWEAKQLAALGARVVHKEKMPMKMALGVLAARKKRAERAEAEAKASHLITGKTFDTSKKKRQREKKEAGGRFKGASAFGQPDTLDPDSMRGPVFYVSKKSRR